MLESDRIHHEGWEYFKEGYQWKRYSKFLAKFYDLNEDDVPVDVRNDWNRIVKKGVKRKANNGEQDSRLHARKLKKKLSEREGTSQQRQQLTISERGDSERETMAAAEDGADSILITTSQQLIRPFRAQLKATNPRMAKELNKRLRIKEIMKMETEGATPFEPREKMTMELFLCRNKKHEVLSSKRNQMITKLEALKAQHKMIEKAKHGEDEFAPIIRFPNGRHCFKIEDLQHFADARGLDVLNLDKFICSTDRREPVYNSKGQCIFCIVHNVYSTIRHQNPNDCAFRFCNCINCYFVSNLHQIGILGND